MSKTNKADIMKMASKGAALSTSKQNNNEDKLEVIPKTIRTMPLDYKTRFENLVSSGKVSGNFSAYIVEALRQRLLHDENGQ